MMWAALVISTFLGGFIQALTGFGGAVILVIVMSWFLSIQVVPSLSCAVCLFLSGAMTWRYRKAINWKQVLLPTAIADIISLLIISQIKTLNVEFLKLLFGIFLMGLSLYFLFLSKKAAIKRPGNGVMIGCSAFSGVTAGLFSISGPTMALYFLAASAATEVYIANLQCHFFITNLIMTAGRLYNGLFTADMVPLIIVGAVGIYLGVFLGEKVRAKFSVNGVRTLVYLAVGISGLVTVIQQLV